MFRAKGDSTPIIRRSLISCNSALPYPGDCIAWSSNTCLVRRQKTKNPIPAPIAIKANGIAVPIAALLPVDSPEPPALEDDVSADLLELEELVESADPAELELAVGGEVTEARSEA